MVDGTRLRILHLVQRQGQATVDNLAQMLEMAPATIRRHLDILQRQHLISFREVRKKTGRPEYSFYLTESGQEHLPKDYHKLLSLLLQAMTSLKGVEIDGKEGTELLEYLLARISEQVVQGHAIPVTGQSTSGKLAVLLDMLRKEDFLPEAEETAKGIRITLLNCPFRYVAMENSAICAFDSHLISTILQAPVRQEACIRDGHPCCTYVALMGADSDSGEPLHKAQAAISRL
ncbi:MAG: ArsR family transcriptional regulator [Chloroflexi bacterium]|nr:ArsR family transcriptional regulator [Chloroflexota bacterium]